MGQGDENLFETFTADVTYDNAAVTQAREGRHVWRPFLFSPPIALSTK